MCDSRGRRAVVKCLADARMARADQADEVLCVQRMLVEAGLEPRNEAQRQFAFARRQRRRRRAGDRCRPRAGPRRTARTWASRRGSSVMWLASVIAMRKPRWTAPGRKGAPCRTGAAAARAPRAPCPISASARGVGCMPRGAHEQRVTPLPPQPGEPDADGGLGATGAPPRASCSGCGRPRRTAPASARRGGIPASAVPSI